MNLVNMAKQLQSMQGELKKARSTLGNLTVVGEAGQGAVKIELSGNLDVKNVFLDPQLLSSEKAARVESLVKEALVSGLKKVQKLAQSHMGALKGMGQ